MPLSLLKLANNALIRNAVDRFFTCRWFFLSLALMLSSELSHAHGKRYFWEMSRSELRALDIRLERERKVLKDAFARLIASDAPSAFGASSHGLSHDLRPLRENSLLNTLRSAQEAMIELEVGTMKKMVLCRSGSACGLKSPSLFSSLIKDDGLSEASAHQTVGAIAATLPQAENRFRRVARDMFDASTLRWKNRSRVLLSLRSGAKYGAAAFGPLSMAAGSLAFGITFTVVELFESMTLGPLHWVCQANWFWAASVGLTVASLSRDLKGWTRDVAKPETNGQTIDPSGVLSKAVQAWMRLLEWRSARELARDPGLFITTEAADFEPLRYHSGLKRLTEEDHVGFGVRSWMSRDEILWSMQVRDVLARSKNVAVDFARHKIGWDGRPVLDMDQIEFDQLVLRLEGPMDIQIQVAVLRVLLRSELDRAFIQKQLSFLSRSSTQNSLWTDQWINQLGTLDHDLRLIELSNTKALSLGPTDHTGLPRVQFENWLERLWNAESDAQSRSGTPLCRSAFL